MKLNDQPLKCDIEEVTARAERSRRLILETQKRLLEIALRQMDFEAIQAEKR